MFHILKNRSTHSGKLERWLGPNKVAELSKLHTSWYGPPIALGEVPGAVYCRGGGDFVGNIDAGGFQNYWDHSIANVKRYIRTSTKQQRLTFGTGFATLAGLIQAAQYGYAQNPITWFSGYTATLNRAVDTWQGSTPAQGAVAAAAPGGTTYSSANSRAGIFKNAQSGKTLTMVNGSMYGDSANPSFLICDRLFGVAKTMNSTASEAVTGQATRYQSTTSTDPDWAGGNFVYPVVNTLISAVAHNHTVCQYTNQSGVTGSSFPSIAGFGAGTAIGNVDLGNGSTNYCWFMPLVEGDVGVKNITQLQTSALLVAGAIDFVLSHPLYWLPNPVQVGSGVTPWPWITNGINSAMQLTRVFDGACLYAYMPYSQAGGVNTLHQSLDIVEG